MNRKGLTIHLKELRATYESGNVLQGISASFGLGLHYLVGLNGCGKSSLLKSMLKLIPYQGKINFDEIDIQSLNAKQMAKQIAFVPQHLAIHFPIKVQEFLLTGRFPYLDMWGTYQKQDLEIVHQYVETLNLTAFLNRKLSEVSGGELQRIYLARALAQETPIILLDEPAQALDPKSKTFLYEYLLSLSKTKTILCATHDLFPLENENIWVCGMKNGEILMHQKGGNVREQLFRVIYEM